MKKGLLTLFLIVLLAACSTNNSAPELAAEDSTAIDTKVVSTSTATLILTKTPKLTNTPTITPTRASFQEPETGFYEDAIYSPDGKWVSWSGCCRDLNLDDARHVIIENKDGSLRWVVEQKTKPYFDHCFEMCILQVVHWSQDGRYAYVAAHITGDGPKIIGTTAIQLVRVDLQTGKEKYLFSGKNLGGYGISNNDVWLAHSFRRDDQLFFVLKNLQSGTQSVVENENEEIGFPGDFVWMPDDKGFVFNTVDNKVENSVLFMWYFNVETLSYWKIFQIENCFAVQTEWLSETELQYVCGYSYPEGKLLILNATTLQVQVINE